MQPEIKIFGAKAEIHLRYEGDIQSLAAILSKSLLLPDFSINHREDPPYDILGSVEAFASELCLENSQAKESFQYRLRMETEDCFNEIFKGQMHDISPWLARFVSKICKLDRLSGDSGLVFIRGKPFGKT